MEVRHAGCSVNDFCYILDVNSLIDVMCAYRHKTGRKHQSSECNLIELSPRALTWFQYVHALNNSYTQHMRYSPPTPFRGTSIIKEMWNPVFEFEEGFTSPWSYSVDRVVALVQLSNVTQGRYTCANNGTCIAPDTCACAKGWMGFDCRVPICEQGFFEKEQHVFVKGVNDDEELRTFEKFMQPGKSYRLNPAGSGYSNPAHVTVVERFMNDSFILRLNETMKGQRYLQQHYPFHQGGYECSIRAVTEWEDYRSGRSMNHSNYFSRFMDKKVESDGFQYTHWNEMGWDPMYIKSLPLFLRESSMNITDDTDRVYVYTDEGYLLEGVWTRTESNWTKGRCIVEFKRVCDGQIKMYDLEAEDVGQNMDIDTFVQDTDLVSYNYQLRFIAV